MEGMILSFFSVAMPAHVKATSEDGCRDWRAVYLDTPPAAQPNYRRSLGPPLTNGQAFLLLPRRGQDQHRATVG